MTKQDWKNLAIAFGLALFFVCIVLGAMMASLVEGGIYVGP